MPLAGPASAGRLVRDQAVPLSQLLYSAASASLLICIVLADLTAEQQTRLLAAQLAAVLAGALVRALVLEPVLIIGRSARKSAPSLALSAVPLAITLFMSAFGAALWGLEFLVLTPLFYATLLGDGLRYASWADGNTLAPLAADAVLATGSLLAVISLILPQRQAGIAIALIVTVYIVWLAILAWSAVSGSSTGRPVSFREAIALGRYQAVDQALGLASLQVPALLYAGSPAQFAAFRLTQSALGPLNVLQQAIGTKLLTGLHTAQAPSVKLPLFLGAVSFFYAMVTGLVVVSLLGEAAVQPIVALGVTMACTAVAGPYIYSLRAHRAQRHSLAVRLFVAATAVAVPTLLWASFDSAQAAVWGWMTAMSLCAVTVWPFAARRRLGRP